MVDLNVQATDEAREYLSAIAGEMALLFSIPIEEAYGRINREFAARSFTTEIEVLTLLHEEEDVWAKHIYYGRESFWWVDEDGASPQKYP